MMDRRKFMIASTAIACSSLAAGSGYTTHFSLLKEPYQTIDRVHRDLFRHSSISALLDRINAVGFLSGVLADKYVDTEDKKLIVNGVTWLHEEAQKLYRKRYYQLNGAQRRKVLLKVNSYKWGDKWLYALMEYFFEAMLGDPLYGGNGHQVGWKHLDLVSGYPRPRGVLL